MDPLSSDREGDAWRQFREGTELVEEIKKDLTRLYPDGVDHERFHTPRAQEVRRATAPRWP